MDKTTFTRLVLDAEQTLYRVAKTILRSDADCEDAVQEAILHAYEKLDTLRQEALFQTWLTRILINECYRLCRRARPQLPFDDCAAEISENPSEDAFLWECIQRLPDDLRLPVELYYAEGYTVPEIRKILNIPEGTVKSRLFRARKTLQKSLEIEV